MDNSYLRSEFVVDRADTGCPKVEQKGVHF